MGNIDFTVSAVLSSLVFSTVGLFVFRKGKRETEIKLMVIGILLMGYTYFTHGPLADWGVGVALCALAYNFWD